MLEILFNVSARVLALGLLAAAAAWLLRRRPADLRHAIWLTALAGMLLLPAFILFLPPLPLLPAPAPVSLDLMDLPNPAPAASAASPSNPSSTPFNWNLVPEIIYLSLAAAALLRLALSLRKTRRLIAQATPIDDPHPHAILAAEAARQGLPAPLPALRQSDAVRVPFTAGWRAPVLLLPSDWPSWDDFRLRSVLAHELAHVRRSDWATAILAAANRSLFWFHPQAWWIEHRLAALAEEACDAAAIQSTNDPEAYAGVVLHFAAALPTHPHLPATAMARNSKVGVRIERILEGHPMLTQTLTRGRWLALALFSMPLLYTAAALQRQEPTAPPLPGPPPVLSLQPTQVEAIQLRATANPDDVDARAQLMVTHLANNNIDGFAAQLLWLVENHPESSVHDTYAPQISRARAVIRDAATLTRLDTLWRKHAAANPSNITILRHAARYLFDADPTAALELMRTAKLVAPADPAINSTTLNFYTLLALTQVSRRNSPVWVAAADEAISQLSSSNDAALVGGVGKSLSALKIRLASSAPQQSAEDARARTSAVRQLSLKLLDRAIALDPANPDWKTARQAATQMDVVAVQTPPIPNPEPAPRSAGEPPRRITVGGNVQQAMLVSAPRPEYPPLAKQARIQGIVAFDVVIGTDGHVIEPKLVSGHPLLVQSAIAALQQYVYKPTHLNGVPIEVVTRVEIAFTLVE